jgi:hypothetical protein
MFGEWAHKAEEALQLLRNISADLRELVRELRERRESRV